MEEVEVTEEQICLRLGPIIQRPYQIIEWLLNDNQNQWYCCILRNALSFEDTKLIYKVCQRDCIKRYPNILYGKEYLQPRVQCVYSDPDVTGQSYSNQRIESIPWNPLILRVKNFISRDGFFPNSCLTNGYINKDDYVSWHRDKEMIDGRLMVCTVSIGGSRRFLFRKYNDHSIKIETVLNDGDIVYFWGNTNKEWEHTIPKPRVSDDRNPRYSLTFRKIDQI